MVYFVVEVYGLNGHSFDKYNQYIHLVKPIVESYGGRYLIRSQNLTPLSLKWQPERLIVIEFDTREHLDKCFASDEYKVIADQREQSVDARAIIVEGI